MTLSHLPLNELRDLPLVIVLVFEGLLLLVILLILVIVPVVLCLFVLVLLLVLGDILVIVDLDRLRDQGIHADQTLASAVLTDSIPPECLLFILDAASLNTLRSFRDFSYREWEENGRREPPPSSTPSKQEDDKISERTPSADRFADLEMDRAADARVRRANALNNTLAFLESECTTKCSNRACRIILDYGSRFCNRCGMPAKQLRFHIKRERSRSEPASSATPGVAQLTPRPKPSRAAGVPTL